MNLCLLPLWLVSNHSSLKRYPKKNSGSMRLEEWELLEYQLQCNFCSVATCISESIVLFKYQMARLTAVQCTSLSVKRVAVLCRLITLLKS